MPPFELRVIDRPRYSAADGSLPIAAGATLRKHPMSDNISQRLATFVATHRRDHLPASVQHDAKRAILNMFAAGFGGCRDAAAGAMIKVIAPLSGAAQAHVMGRSERLDPASAAWINAAIANVLDFDDTHLATVIHPTSPIAPALLALAEMRADQGKPIAGGDLLHAFALGVEVTCRVGNAISPGHYNRGWHITGTCGVLGAAAAVSRLLKLDAERTLWALGNAATQASGLVETLGFHAKSLNPANAARGGLLAALLAEAGLSGPPRPIEGQRGFLKVLADKVDTSRLTAGLGETWELSLNALKPYPCGVVLHPVIDACLGLRAKPGFDAAKIEHIAVHGNSLLKARADRQVTTGREAQVCLSHTVAVSLLLGRAGPPEYTDALVNDPKIRRIANRVVMVVDDTIPVEAAAVEATLLGGAKLQIHVPHARGSAGRPMTDDEIEAKLADQARLNVPGHDIRRLADTVWGLDKADDAAIAIRHAAAK